MNLLFLVFTFISTTHSELIFVYEVEFVSFLTHIDTQLTQHLLLKRLAFPHCPAVSALS